MHAVCFSWSDSRNTPACAEAFALSIPAPDVGLAPMRRFNKPATRDISSGLRAAAKTSEF
jgi:hypothetical protein